MAGPWFVRSAAAGTADGLSWTNAKTTLAAAATAASAGDIIWVADDHAETQASAMTVTFPGTRSSPNFVYCADHTQASPGTGDLKTSGAITTTGNNAITIVGSAYVYGLTFSCGTGAVAPAFAIGNVTAFTQKYDSCSFQLPCTGAAFFALFNQNGATASYLEFYNTTVLFAATGQSLAGGGGRFVWRNTPSAILGSTLPTTLVFAASTVPGDWYFEGVDLSALGSGKTIISGSSSNKGMATFKDCRLGASVTLAAQPAVGNGGFDVVAVRCDSSGTNYVEQLYKFGGTQVDETTIIRTGGASDGTTGKSRKVTTSANAKWILPFECLPMQVWNDTTGSSVNVTIEGIADPRDFSALPNNDEVWFDVEYLGASGNPQGSFASGTKANNLATGAALTASTQAWDSLATARQNSHAYSLGDVFKSANNAGRLFVVTTAGTSAGSEPGGIASAVDGGSVTDGTATVKAMWRFKQTVAVTPQLKGPITAYIKAAKASITRIFFDPKIALS